MDLFKKFGYITAAGDRYLAKFCGGKWYLENPERVADMYFTLTPVSWRNVNIPNAGQIPNWPISAVVETNAVFRAGSLNPAFAGPAPKEIYPLVT